MPRYQVTGLPPVTQRGVSAFLPHFNLMAASGAQKYKGEVTGWPGTVGIPTAPAIPSPDLGDVALMGLSRSVDAPNLNYPNIYWTRPEPNYRPGLLIQMYDPVAPQLTTMIPVPAVSLRQAYIRRAATLAMGLTGTGTDPQGQRQIRQPLSGLKSWASRRVGNGLPRG